MPGPDDQPLAHFRIDKDGKVWNVVDELVDLGFRLDPWQQHMLAEVARARAQRTVSPRLTPRPGYVQITQGRPPRRLDEFRGYVDEIQHWQTMGRVLARATQIVEANRLVQQHWADAFREFRHTTDYVAWAEWQALAPQAQQPRDFSAELAAHGELVPCVDLVDGYRFGRTTPRPIAWPTKARFGTVDATVVPRAGGFTVTRAGRYSISATLPLGRRT